MKDNYGSYRDRCENIEEKIENLSVRFDVASEHDRQVQHLGDDRNQKDRLRLRGNEDSLIG